MQYLQPLRYTHTAERQHPFKPSSEKAVVNFNFYGGYA